MLTEPIRQGQNMFLHNIGKTLIFKAHNIDLLFLWSFLDPFQRGIKKNRQEKQEKKTWKGKRFRKKIDYLKLFCFMDFPAIFNDHCTKISKKQQINWPKIEKRKT